MSDKLDLKELTKDILHEIENQMQKEKAKVEEDLASRNILKSSITAHEIANVQIDILRKELLNALLIISTSKPNVKEWESIKNETIYFINKKQNALIEDFNKISGEWDPHHLKFFTITAECKLFIEGKKREIQTKLFAQVWNMLRVLIGVIVGALLAHYLGR